MLASLSCFTRDDYIFCGIVGPWLLFACVSLAPLLRIPQLVIVTFPITGLAVLPAAEPEH